MKSEEHEKEARRTMKKILCIALALLAAGAAQAQEWYESMKFKGDVRYRHERIDDDSAKEARERHRIRARLSADARLNPQVNAVIGVTTTEGGDPISGNQTLTGGGTKKEIYLDLGYVDFHPEAINGLSVWAGKMKNPYVSVADLVWDGDYTPEGGALKYHVGEDIELLLNGGAFWLRENKADDDVMQYGGQAALNIKASDIVELMLGSSYYMTENLEGALVLDFQNANSSFGNSTENSVSGTTTNKIYGMEYAVVEPFAQITLNTAIPVKFYGQYAVNSEADDNDTGYLAGLTIGKAKDPKTFEFSYNYRDLEKDCVLGAFTDSDNSGGGTDNRGHKFQVKYQFLKNWQAAVTYFLDEKKVSSDPIDYNRLQVDVAASF